MKAIIDYRKENSDLVINFSGDFASYRDEKLKNKLFESIKDKDIKNIVIKSNGLGSWDSSLTIILFSIKKISQEKNINVDISGLPEGICSLLKLAFAVDRKPTSSNEEKTSFVESLGEKTIFFYDVFKSGIGFIYDVMKSIRRYIRTKAVYRKVDFLFALEDCGFKALPIVALISFMVGLILAFVGAMQLKMFGAQIYVSSLVAIAMVRLMGAMMTGIIMAGRTGASYAATLGTMQVNEEIDALKTMGIPEIDFLVLPRILALMVMMPILTIFSDIIGIGGGAIVGIFMLELSPSEYLKTTIEVLNFTHFIIGILHGFIFGCIIAICGCYQGIKCGKDADSVGKATTNAVVYSIIWIVIATSIITIICQLVGI